jgi:hypothetical protein
MERKRACREASIRRAPRVKPPQLGAQNMRCDGASVRGSTALRFAAIQDLPDKNRKRGESQSGENVDKVFTLARVPFDAQTRFVRQNTEFCYEGGGCR